jgi:hypothetical protein
MQIHGGTGSINASISLRVDPGATRSVTLFLGDVDVIQIGGHVEFVLLNEVGIVCQSAVAVMICHLSFFPTRSGIWKLGSSTFHRRRAVDKQVLRCIVGAAGIAVSEIEVRMVERIQHFCVKIHPNALRNRNVLDDRDVRVDEPRTLEENGAR